ncbi:efflux transporter outer membrane subunit [Bradyrhizobium sp. SZCCHNS2002]|uniref:efflux transporter outer membrane subunit n=1 Tax=Bradyrhizobium sp. SZCCHNS2002 TaxID=3057302 RepID=UPI002915F895|nr:efflux transporter outer membrane subunit [Bradyrhizobium sp. SZCCHNS2002]
MRFAILLPLLLTACAVGPSYKKPDFKAMPDQWLENVSVPDVSALNLPWWRALHDPVLNKLVDTALANNGDLKVAMARVEEARAERLAAQAALLPNVNGKVNAVRGNTGTNTIDRTANLFDSEFDASWELDIFGGGRRAAEAARATLQSRRASVHQVQVSLLAEVVRNYVDYRRLEQQIKLTQENLAAQQSTLVAVREQVKEGVASLLDLSRVESQAGTTEADIPDLTSQLVSSRNNLAVLAGMTPEQVLPYLASEPLPTVTPKLVLSTPASVIASRPDVQVAERDLAAATANQGVALSNWFPKVNLAGLFGLQHLAGIPSFQAWNVGGTIQLPIIDFGRVRAMVRQADARQQEALATYEQTIRAALADVESSLTAYAKARDREVILEKAAKASRQAEELARIQYKEGIASLLDVLDAQRQRLETETTLVAAKANVGKTYAALYKALGGGANFHTDSAK